MDSAWSKADRGAIWFILGVAVLYAATVVVVGVTGIIGNATSGVRRLSLLVDQPLPEAAQSNGTAVLVDGAYESAWVAIGRLGAGTNALLTIGEIVAFLAQAAVAIAFAYLAWRLLRRQPFLRSLSNTFLVAGSTLALGGLIAQFLLGFGSWNAILELGSGEPGDFWPLMMRLDPAQVGLGFALLLVAVAFHYGARLSRDTEGLV